MTELQKRFIKENLKVIRTETEMKNPDIELIIAMLHHIEKFIKEEIEWKHTGTT